MRPPPNQSSNPHTSSPRSMRGFRSAASSTTHSGQTFAATVSPPVHVQTGHAAIRRLSPPDHLYRQSMHNPIPQSPVQRAFGSGSHRPSHERPALHRPVTAVAPIPSASHISNAYLSPIAPQRNNATAQTALARSQEPALPSATVPDPFEFIRFPDDPEDS
jgi:hypothetical protein